MTKQRCHHRIDLISGIVNKRICHYNKKRIKFESFNVCHNIRDKLLSPILDEISNWNGGRKCDEYKSLSFNEWFKKVQIWWNRDKAVKLGNHLFYPLLMLIIQVKVYYLY